MANSAYREFTFGLGEVIDTVRDQVRRFAAERIAPRAQEMKARCIRGAIRLRSRCPDMTNAAPLIGKLGPSQWVVPNQTRTA